MDDQWQMEDVVDETKTAGQPSQAPAQPSQAPAQQVPIRKRWFVDTPLPPLVPVPQLQSFRYNRLGAREFPSSILYLMQQGNVVFNGNRQGHGGAVTAAHGRFYWTWKEVPWKWEP